jgi:hypothetical protein
MIKGNPPRMFSIDAVKRGGVGSIFITPHGEVFALTVDDDGEHFLRRMSWDGPVMLRAHRLTACFGPHGPVGVAVGLRMVYKPSS